MSELDPHELIRAADEAAEQMWHSVGVNVTDLSPRQAFVTGAIIGIARVLGAGAGFDYNEQSGWCHIQTLKWTEAYKEAMKDGYEDQG